MLNFIFILVGCNVLNRSLKDLHNKAIISLKIQDERRGYPNGSTLNFLGHKIKDSGTLETNIKGGFGVQSDWPQLFNLVMKMNAELKWEKNTEDLHSADNAQLILKSGDKTKILQSNRIHKEVIEDQLFFLT